MPQERPDLVRSPEPDERHGGPRLPLGQSIFCLFALSRLLCDLRLEEGYRLRVVPLGEWEERRKSLAAGIHQQLGQHGRLVAGVIRQDVGGEGPLGVGTPLGPQGRG